MPHLVREFMAERAFYVGKIKAKTSREDFLRFQVSVSSENRFSDLSHSRTQNRCRDS